MSVDQAHQLRYCVQRLFRSFGALNGNSTPCGKPLSIAHAHALMTLLEHGQLSQKQLGQHLGIDKSNVARLAAKMVEAGHASQRPCEENRRSRLVTLTEAGIRAARSVEQSSAQRFAQLLECLPAKRRGVVLEGLGLLVQSMEGMAASGGKGENAK